jgi:transcriptional repressor NrdR
VSVRAASALAEAKLPNAQLVRSQNSNTSKMQCPYCQYTDSRVLESRSTGAGQSIRRRRECLQCKHRFTTYERVELFPVTVIKQDGRREYFDRSKLLHGIIHACQKTGLSQTIIEGIVEEIESQLQARTLREVTTAEIGELVLAQLRPLSSLCALCFCLSSIPRDSRFCRYIAPIKNRQSGTKFLCRIVRI